MERGSLSSVVVPVLCRDWFKGIIWKIYGQGQRVGFLVKSGFIGFSIRSGGVGNLMRNNFRVESLLLLGKER